MARGAALTIAAGRLGLGVSALVVTDRALQALGFAQPDSAGRALARLVGTRDVALALLALAARDDREALRDAVLAGAAVDALDAVSLGLAASDPATRSAALRGLAAGSAAALAGAWVWRRLS